MLLLTGAGKTSAPAVAPTPPAHPCGNWCPPLLPPAPAARAVAAEPGPCLLPVLLLLLLAPTPCGCLEPPGAPPAAAAAGCGLLPPLFSPVTTAGVGVAAAARQLIVPLLLLWAPMLPPGRVPAAANDAAADGEGVACARAGLFRGEWRNLWRVMTRTAVRQQSQQRCQGSPSVGAERLGKCSVCTVHMARNTQVTFEHFLATTSILVAGACQSCRDCTVLPEPLCAACTSSNKALTTVLLLLPSRHSCA